MGGEIMDRTLSCKYMTELLMEKEKDPEKLVRRDTEYSMVEGKSVR